MEENKKILFVVNKTKTNAEVIAKRLAELAQANAIDYEICDEFPVPENVFKNKDICCVIGGDGTILSCVPPIVKNNLPVFGINLGKLGFLATYTEKITDEEFLTLVNGQRRILERALLETVYEGKRYIALNDLVLKDVRLDGISKFSITADNEFIATYTGDGLIFSTATGSTAYNLSAGGPIIHPKGRVFAMTPICPHTLSNRSLIFDYGAQIKIECVSGESALISDGKKVATLTQGSKVEISMLSNTLKFVRMRGHSHFAILRNKLGWADDPRKKDR
ncbi:MAG: NAD(+)/NADH kinase [Opitutales bacterium]|nr:NAD(+)/NADH kinase [Opitutales bacterium]